MSNVCQDPFYPRRNSLKLFAKINLAFAPQPMKQTLLPLMTRRGLRSAPGIANGTVTRPVSRRAQAGLGSERASHVSLIFILREAALDVTLPPPPFSAPRIPPWLVSNPTQTPINK